jgi:hypothetical protein
MDEVIEIGTVTDEELRQAIIREVAELLPRRVVREPFMFTAVDVAKETGRPYVRVMDDLKQMVAEGRLRSELRGYDPTTGRRVMLFWRSEDEPAL